MKGAILSATAHLLTLLITLASTTFLFGDFPPHVSDLRQLQENVSPKDNSYRHHHNVVLWKGFDGSEQYICHADCSGLMNGLFRHTYHYDKDKMMAWFGTVRPLALDYYHTAKKENKFQLVQGIRNLEVGDFVILSVFKSSPMKRGPDSGHIMMANAKPQLLGIDPLHGGGKWQIWSLEVIDSTHGHGKTDTRYRNGRFWPGIGRGSIALFTDEQGNIVGYTWSVSPRSIFYTQKQRPLIVGRYPTAARKETERPLPRP